MSSLALLQIVSVKTELGISSETGHEIVIEISSSVPSYFIEEERVYPARRMSSVAAFKTKSFDTVARSICRILPPHAIAGAFSDIRNLAPLAFGRLILWYTIKVSRPNPPRHSTASLYNLV